MQEKRAWLVFCCFVINFSFDSHEHSLRLGGYGLYAFRIQILVLLVIFIFFSSISTTNVAQGTSGLCNIQILSSTLKIVHASHHHRYKIHCLGCRLQGRDNIWYCVSCIYFYCLYVTCELYVYIVTFALSLFLSNDHDL